MSRAFVVVLERPEPGVIDVPGVPDAAGLRNMMRSQVAGYEQNTGRTVESPPSYLEDRSGPVLGFTVDVTKAKRFPTREAAQAAIGAIPSMVRPGGLTVRPVD